MVTDSNKKHVGILSSRDIQRAFAEIEFKDLHSLTTSNFMTRKDQLCVVSPTDSIKTAAKTMEQRNIRHIPVVKDEECIAMLSVKDVIGEVLRQEVDAKKAMQTVVTDSVVNALKK